MLCLSQSIIQKVKIIVLIFKRVTVLSAFSRTTQLTLNIMNNTAYTENIIADAADENYVVADDHNKKTRNDEDLLDMQKNTQENSLKEEMGIEDRVRYC